MRILPSSIIATQNKKLSPFEVAKRFLCLASGKFEYYININV
jgi:hypothetical protein